jgi:hypothetical protein
VKKEEKEEEGKRGNRGKEECFEILTVMMTGRNKLSEEV